MEITGKILFFVHCILKRVYCIQIFSTALLFQISRCRINLTKYLNKMLKKVQIISKDYL